MSREVSSIRAIKKLLSEVESNIDYLLRWDSDPGKVKTEAALFNTQSALQLLRDLEPQVASLGSLLDAATKNARTEKPAFGYEVIVWEPSKLRNAALYRHLNQRRAKRA